MARGKKNVSAVDDNPQHDGGGVNASPQGGQGGQHHGSGLKLKLKLGGNSKFNATDTGRINDAARRGEVNNVGGGGVSSAAAAKPLKLKLSVAKDATPLPSPSMPLMSSPSPSISSKPRIKLALGSMNKNRQDPRDAETSSTPTTKPRILLKVASSAQSSIGPLSSPSPSPTPTSPASTILTHRSLSGTTPTSPSAPVSVSKSKGTKRKHSQLRARAAESEMTSMGKRGKSKLSLVVSAEGVQGDQENEDEAVESDADADADADVDMDMDMDEGEENDEDIPEGMDGEVSSKRSRGRPRTHLVAAPRIPGTPKTPKVKVPKNAQVQLPVSVTDSASPTTIAATAASAIDDDATLTSAEQDYPQSESLSQPPINVKVEAVSDDKPELAYGPTGGDDSPAADLSSVAQNEEEYYAFEDGPEGESPSTIDQSASATPSGISKRGKWGSTGGSRPFYQKKKPLQELLRKFIVEMKRKDSYGLFLEPVSVTEYPGYFDVIGGEDKAMDFETMERKIDDRQYQDFDQVEADVEKMITAAQSFNPEDSVVAKEAEKMKALSIKLVARFKPVVRTPSPEPMYSSHATPFDSSAAMSPSAGFDTGSQGLTPGRSISPMISTLRGMSAKPRTVPVSEIPPNRLIPEKMLQYPPNSDAARTIAFYQTGGKRLRSRKEQKSREKWDGQWREWYTSGPRRLAEVEDIGSLIAEGFVLSGPADGSALPEIIDWQDPVMDADDIWQPTPTMTGIFIDEEIPTFPIKTASHTDFGPFADIPTSYGYDEVHNWNEDQMVDRIRNELGQSSTQELASALQYIKGMSTGEDVRAEAYHRSVQNFLSGVEKVARKRLAQEDVKMELPEESPLQQLDLQNRLKSHWRDGFLKSHEARSTVERATTEYNSLQLAKPPLQDTQTVLDLVKDSTEPVDFIRSAVLSTKRRIPIARDLAEYSARRDGLDLGCLLKAESDFSHGSAFPPPPPPGEKKIEWFGNVLLVTGKQIVDHSTGIEAKAPKMAPLTRLRLDLLALAKNVPVQELKPMTMKESLLLPPAVRGLVKISPSTNG